jgi:hypothetical protein
MTSVSKKEQNINKSLDDLYIVNNGATIISWLDSLKVYNSTDGKIPGLFLKSKTKIKIEGETYNLILQWIKNNKDKFSNYDFTGIPNNEILLSSSKKNFETIEDIELWSSNPTIHPLTGAHMMPNGYKYQEIYKKAYNIMINNKIDKAEIPSKLPKNHILFGSIDLLYYINNNKNKVNKYKDATDYLFELLEYEFMNNLDLLDGKNIFEQEFTLIEKCFDGDDMKSTFEDYCENLVDFFLDNICIDKYYYPQRTEMLKFFVNKEHNSAKETSEFIKLLENNKFSNGYNIIEYLQKEYKKIPYYWIKDALNIYDSYKMIYTDIDDCYNPNKGIIENAQDKKLLMINDPLDPYFDEFEKKLEKIKNPKYSKLIDLTTFKPKENLKYLNNAEYKEFKNIRNKYDNAFKRYRTALNNYEIEREEWNLTNDPDIRPYPRPSPLPPVKPKYKLPWGKVHIIAGEIDPIHIKDNIVKNFFKDYNSVLPTITEYNKIKNMPYLELKKNMTTSSPSSFVKKLIKDNLLLGMTKQKIYADILYDDSELADKCSESIDILTNEELDDENYPLSKLQLMVRLKVYTPDKKKYRTECIYAPKLYNYLIKCINNKEPFINPVTKAKYTQENIDDLMKVMKIIDPTLEVPVFIKHMNDTKLKLEYRVITETYNDLDSSFGDINIIRYYNVYLSRSIGYKEYEVYNICTIPADIEAGGIFATGSSDLTSEVMLFGIYRLFNEGRLLHKYIPPYRIEYIYEGTLEYSYIKTEIHFNQYYDSKMWIPLYETTKEDFINMFKHYAEEVKNYLY